MLKNLKIPIVMLSLVFLAGLLATTVSPGRIGAPSW